MAFASNMTLSKEEEEYIEGGEGEGAKRGSAAVHVEPAMPAANMDVDS